MDSSDCIFVTGNVGGALANQTYTGSSDIALLKYDGTGSQIWARQVGTIGSDIGYAGESEHLLCRKLKDPRLIRCYFKVAVDSNDYVYVTGRVSGSLHGEVFAGDSDIVLMKYDGFGSRFWTRLLGSTAEDVGYGGE